MLGISGVDKIKATALDGLAQSSRSTSTSSKTCSEASQDIRDAIDAIRGDLPLEMEEPILTRFDPARLPAPVARRSPRRR